MTAKTETTKPTAPAAPAPAAPAPAADVELNKPAPAAGTADADVAAANTGAKEQASDKPAAPAKPAEKVKAEKGGAVYESQVDGRLEIKGVVFPHKGAKVAVTEEQAKNEMIAKRLAYAVELGTLKEV